MAEAVGVGGLAGEAQLRCSPDVSMMQVTDFADGHDLPSLRPLDRPPVRCILGEGEVGSGVVVADEPFREGILPRLRAAVRTSRICMPFTRRRKESP
jgi:hypothetical protein